MLVRIYYLSPYNKDKENDNPLQIKRDDTSLKAQGFFLLRRPNKLNNMFKHWLGINPVRPLAFLSC